ncbi:histamine receptor [Aureococcus anophagefferens]|uniref:Histamine receptor n=1 Tax=Aureococcus anophagefferens TaxID=44056 RepID=A0ABR1FZJ7_AURAN
MSITCTSCGDVLEPAGFSKNQLQTPKTARCRWCVEQASQQRRAPPPATQQRRARPPPATTPPPTAATPPPPPEAELAALAVADPAAAAAQEEGGARAIFGDEFRPLPPGGAAARYEIALAADRAAVALDVVCGAGYPVDGAPAFAARAPSRGARRRARALTCVAAAAAAAAPAGEVCVFEVAAAVRDAFGQRPVRFDAASGDDAHAVEIFDGEPVTDRRSAFQAFLAVGVDSLDKAQWAFRAILARNKCGRATHNMRAYRFTDAAGVRRADNDSGRGTARREDGGLPARQDPRGPRPQRRDNARKKRS